MLAILPLTVLAAGVSGLLYQLIVAVIIICLLLAVIYVIQNYVPLPAPFKNLAIIVVAVILIIYLLLLALNLSGLG